MEFPVFIRLIQKFKNINYFILPLYEEPMTEILGSILIGLIN